MLAMRGNDRMPARKWLLGIVAVACFAVPAPSAGQTLDIYFIDVEGGQATLIVTPSGESMLIDTGWDGFGDRDPKRIMAAAADARVARLDYLLITHFHRDHMGGAPEVVRRLPVGTFLDYGRPVEEGLATQSQFTAYTAVRAKGTLRHPAPGETIPLKGVEVDVVSAAGAVLPSALADASGDANPACASGTSQPERVTENPRSLGVRIRFGQFTFLDVGDLSGSTLAALACPKNLLGHIDAYLVPHHGGADTAIPSVIAAVSPRVAILNNGAAKGGDAPTFAALRAANGVENVWQLHRTQNQGAVNFPDAFIANLEDGAGDTGAWIKLSAREDGSFTVTNGRTGFSRSYK
jgi:competence protein ComEC